MIPVPSSLTFGEITHHSVEVSWQKDLDSANETHGHGDGKQRFSVELQREDNAVWETCYTGYSGTSQITHLEPLSQYKFRARFVDKNKHSDWSPMCTVYTMKEPLTGEHLHRAVQHNDRYELQKILETRQVDIDVMDKYGYSPLMQAAQKGYYEIVEILLDNSADIGQQNESGKTCLMLACYTGKLDVVKLLRKRGASLTQRDNAGSGAIHYAADGGDHKLVEWLIKDGADPNMKEKTSGWTPLMRCAAISGNKKVAETLVKAGAEVDVIDLDGKTPLMVAVINGHVELTEFLLKSGANIHVKNEFGKNVFDMAKSMEKRLMSRFLESYIRDNNIPAMVKF